ncbi:MAG: hypothetical protein HGB37_00890 [Candidatus Moranbacteria bacterium]|jgi:hypothetical protein|nr:hypothetical protein [Candidatus Moranbacteria bacterium]NTW89454.1 hypothetical protein [Candidatus Moranbacteria bacterium]
MSEANVKPGRAKRLVTIFLVVLCICGAVFLYFFANQPSRDTKKSTLATSDTKTAVQKPQEEFAGKYVSFTHGGDYVVKTHDTDEREGAVILESAYLSETSALSKKIGLTVRFLPSKSADADPDYTMRRQNPDRYRMDSFDFDGMQGTSFTSVDTGTFEKTCFMRHGDKMVSLTLGAPGAEDAKVDAEAEALVRSIRWNQ